MFPPISNCSLSAENVSLENKPGDGGAGGDQTTPTPITLDAIKTAGVPDSYLKDGAYDFATIGKDLGELATSRTQAAERAKLVPASADKYDLALPKDVKVPDGFEWRSDTPFAKAFTEYAHKHGLTQEQVTDAVKMRMAAQMAEQEADKKFFDGEMAKLGASAQTRLKTLHDSLKGAVGDKGAAELAAMTSTAEGVQALEKLISLAGGPKLADKAAIGGDAKPDITKMTARQRLDYANSQSAKH